MFAILTLLPENLQQRKAQIQRVGCRFSSCGCESITLYVGSRSRKSSVTAGSGSGSAADGDHPKKQKTGTADRSREKMTHKSPDKRSSQPGGSEAHNSLVLPPVKEEKTTVAMPGSLPESTPLAPSSAPTPSPSSSSASTPGILAPSTQRKKRNMESLPLLSGSSTGDLAFQDESPLPCPMTVPKEEPLRESIAASGGQLSRSLVLPLSPDMHVIVQQPNIAALSVASSSLPSSGAHGSVPVPHAAETKGQQLPPHTVMESSASATKSVPPPLGEPNTEPGMVGVKQETRSDAPPWSLGSPVRPKTAAEALSFTAAIPANQHPMIPPPALSGPSPVLMEQPLGLTMQRTPLPVSHARPLLLHAPPPHLSSDIPTPPPPSTASPHHSPLKQTQLQLPSYSHDPQHPPTLSAPKTISTVLSDPRLSSRPGPSTTPTQQPTLQQFLDKGKSQVANQITGDRGKSKAQSENKGKHKPQNTTSQNTGDKEKGKIKPLLTNQSTGDKGKGRLSQTNSQATAERSQVKLTSTTPELNQPQPKAAEKTKPLTQEATTTDNTKPATVQTTTADKTKPKLQSATTTVKSKQVAEVEKKGETPPQPLTQLTGSRALQECLSQPTVDIVREPWKTDSSEPAKAPVLKTGEKAGESGQSGVQVEATQKRESDTEKEASQADGAGTREEEKKEDKEVEVDGVTMDEKEAKKGAAVEAPASPPSPPHGVTAGVDTQKDKSEEGNKQSSERVSDGVTLDESVTVALNLGVYDMSVSDAG